MSTEQPAPESYELTGRGKAWIDRSFDEAWRVYGQTRPADLRRLMAEVEAEIPAPGPSAHDSWSARNLKRGLRAYRKIIPVDLCQLYRSVDTWLAMPLS